jgi:hypothetical protein
MSELSRLMLKAVRSLPPEEQDALLEAMLEPRLTPWAAPGVPDPGPIGPGLPAGEVFHGPIPPQRVYGPERVEVTLPPLGPETGGPWQSVPVRLSTDQHERLKQWCHANGFTMAVVLRGLVARFLDDQATRRPRSPAGAPVIPGENPGDNPTKRPSNNPGEAPGEAAGEAANQAAGEATGRAGTSSPVPGAPNSGG